MDFSTLLANDVDHLPPFANEYNKQLDREVREKEKKVRELTSAIDREADRADVMRLHMKSTTQETQDTTNLLDARTRTAATEVHLLGIANRESGKLSSDIETIIAKQNELKDKLNVIQNNIFKTTEKVEDFRTQMNWNQDQLEQWAIAEKQKEDDNMSLLKYTKADDVKIKEYTIAIDKLIKEGIKKKAELDSEITETRAAQIQLDKTGEAFKKLHQERQELIKQWEEAIDALKQRDEAIGEFETQHETLKREIGGKEEILREKGKFLEEQKSNNSNLENRIAFADRQLSKVRPQYTQAQASIIEYQDEVETLRNTVGKTATTLETKKGEVLFLKKDILDKKARVERVKQVLQTTQAQLKNEFSRTDSLDARAKQLEIYHKQEETRNKTIDKELAELKQLTFKHSQEIFQMKQNEANLLSEINGSSAASKNLQSKIHKLDSESMKQMELVYNQEYQLQLLERKISRAQGERSNEEKAFLSLKISQLSHELETTNITSSLLSSQLKKVEDDVKAARRTTESATKEKTKIEGKINELELDNESAARSVKAVVKTKEEMLITENFVRIDVKRLRDILYKRADEVYSLGNRKLQLKLAMEERQHDISIHRDSLRDQSRALESEMHSLVKELKEAEARVDNLKKKYELHLFRYAPQGGIAEESGSEKSQAYYVIRAAQEKEELQQIGDSLDLEIAKSEKEVRGLVNTLKVLNAQNEKLHGFRSKPELSSEENEYLMKLEQEYEEVSKEYDSRRRDVAVLQEELNTQNRIVNEKALHCQDLSDQLNGSASRKNQVEKELIDQNMKLQRARQQFVKLGKAYKQNKGISENQETIFERELLLQDRRDQINKQLYNIAQIGKGDAEIEYELTKLASEYSLVLPSSLSSFSRQSNRSSSSSASSFSLSSASQRPPLSTPSSYSAANNNNSSSIQIEKQKQNRPTSTTGTPPRTPIRAPSPSLSPSPSSSSRSPSSRSPSALSSSSSSSKRAPSPSIRSPSLRAPSPSPTRPVQPLVLDNLSHSLSNPSSPKNNNNNNNTTAKQGSARLSSMKPKTPVQSPKASPKSSPSISRPSSSSNIAVSGFEISSRPTSSQKA